MLYFLSYLGFGAEFSLGIKSNTANIWFICKLFFQSFIEIYLFADALLRPKFLLVFFCINTHSLLNCNQRGVVQLRVAPTVSISTITTSTKPNDYPRPSLSRDYHVTPAGRKSIRSGHHPAPDLQIKKPFILSTQLTKLPATHSPHTSREIHREEYVQLNQTCQNQKDCVHDEARVPNSSI